ncbi:hypothetical protein [Kitasatospora sp. NPDC059817]|uniref:hypothetical protein n=1 Tax=Kitasatospora sp. NPDC059817 TaxID=3346961 RepID=UPI003658C945
MHGFRDFDDRNLLGFVDGTENPEGGAATGGSSPAAGPKPVPPDAARTAPYRWAVAAHRGWQRHHHRSWHRSHRGAAGRCCRFRVAAEQEPVRTAGLRLPGGPPPLRRRTGLVRRRRRARPAGLRPGGCVAGGLGSAREDEALETLVDERRRLAALPQRPSAWVEVETGQTFADAWTRADQERRRQLLLGLKARLYMTPTIEGWYLPAEIEARVSKLDRAGRSA